MSTLTAEQIILTPALSCIDTLIASLRRNIARASLNWMDEARINDRLNRAEAEYEAAYAAAQTENVPAYTAALDRIEALYDEAFRMFWTRPAARRSF